MNIHSLHALHGSDFYVSPNDDYMDFSDHTVEDTRLIASRALQRERPTEQTSIDPNPKRARLETAQEAYGDFEMSEVDTVEDLADISQVCASLEDPECRYRGFFEDCAYQALLVEGGDQLIDKNPDLLIRLKNLYPGFRSQELREIVVERIFTYLIGSKQEEELPEFWTNLNITTVNFKQIAMTDESVRILAKSNARLTSAEFHNCCALTDVGLRELGTLCPNLTVLGLHQGLNLTDNTLVMIAECYKQLTLVKLNYCTNFTEDGLDGLRSDSLHLSKIMFENSSFKQAN